MGHQMGQQIGSALRQSIHRIVLVLASFLPGILAFLLAVVVFVLIGWALSALLRRLLIAIRFDERLAETVEWYKSNEAWWRKIKNSDSYTSFTKKWYDERK